MKKFFAEFKTFISRGNVVDMAVGVIVGGAFTAIVNTLGNSIFKPVINWLLSLVLGADSLSEVYTFLHVARLEDGSVDLANSIYIDWGAFINAVINFLIIALVLFLIVRTINRVKAKNEEIRSELKKMRFGKAEKKELAEHGIDIKDKQAVNSYFAEKAAAAKAAEEERIKAEKAAAEKNSVEGLLGQIKDLLETKLKKED